MKLLSQNLEQSLFSCPVQALQMVEGYVQEHWSCVSRCLCSVPACVLVYSVCCLMLNNALRACKDTVHVMVQFLSAVFLIRRRWYQLCCRSESSRSLAHCLQIVTGLYGLTHVKTVGVSLAARKNAQRRCLINERFIQVINTLNGHEPRRPFLLEKNNFSALMLRSLL